MATKKIQEIAQTLQLGPVTQYLESGGAVLGSAKHLLYQFVQTVPTLATLTASPNANAAPGSIIIATGGASAFDGGGGTYIYDSTSVLPVNGSTVVATNNGTGRWRLAPLGAVVAGLALLKANNLSDLASASAARGNLGLGSAATASTSSFDPAGAAAAVQTLALLAANNLGDVPDKNAARINLAAAWSAVTLDKNNNLSELTNFTTARTNLGLGSAATTSSAAYDAAGAATAALANALLKAQNLADLPNKATARGNLGLGDMATQTSSAVNITGGRFIASTNFSAADYPSLRTIKDSLLFVKSVKDFGAIGDFFTDDTAALNAAIAFCNAKGFGCALYFPPGIYSTTGMTTLTGVSDFRAFGQGATIYQTVQANTTWLVDRTCSRIWIDNLVFDGAASSRLNGVHLRFDASNSWISFCEFAASSDFGLFIGQHNNATPTQDVTVVGCHARNTKGDGFHIDNVDGVILNGCTARNTGDDSFAVVGYEVFAGPAKNVRLIGCAAYNSSFRGFAALMVAGLIVADCVSDGAIGANFELGDDGNNAGVFNTDVVVRNFEARNGISTAGPFGAFNLYFCQRVTLQNVTVYNPVTGRGIAVADFDDVLISVSGVRCTRAGFFRGLVLNDQATINGRTTRNAWGALTVNGLTADLQSSTANESIYLIPAAGKTLASLMIIGTVASQLNSASYIVYSAVLAVPKIGNNTCLQARAITQAGGTAATTFNNN